MSQRDPKFDQYIDTAPAYAQPILIHLREIIHKGCPEIKEVVKWGHLSFDYKGKILCGMAAFKNHCYFNFWYSALMQDPHNLLREDEHSALGYKGQITGIDYLPSEAIFIEYIQQSMALIDQGAKLPKKTKAEKEELVIPDELTELLLQNPEADTFFESLSYSNKKEYIVWINDAKTEATRNKRINEAIAMLSERKTKNWKYERPK